MKVVTDLQFVISTFFLNFQYQILITRIGSKIKRVNKTATNLMIGLLKLKTVMKKVVKMPTRMMTMTTTTTTTIKTWTLMNPKRTESMVPHRRTKKWMIKIFIM